MTDDTDPNFARDALNFHWQEVKRLTADNAMLRGLLKDVQEFYNYPGVSFGRNLANEIDAALSRPPMPALGAADAAAAGEQGGAE